MTTDAKVGRTVANLMRDAGISQVQMAERMGVTQASISRKLSGERPWFADELVAAAKILGVQVGDFFGERSRARRLSASAPFCAEGSLVFSG